VKSVNVVAVCH